MWPLLFLISCPWPLWLPYSLSTAKAVVLNLLRHLRFSSDFDSVRIVPLAPASLPAAVLRPGGLGYGVPLGMHRMNPESEPDDEDEEEDDRKEEDDDGDEGYSE